MYLTQINMVRGLTKAEYFKLRELCFFSNCLYNFALYNVRQQFFKDKTYSHFESNYHKCKDNGNYKLLQPNMAQQTLRAVDFAFKLFFGSVGKIKTARPPRYRKKGGLYNLIITGNSISIQNGYLTVPQSRTYTKVLNDHRIKIKVPERLIGKRIKEVKIIPLQRGQAFKIAYCYEVDEEVLNLNKENSLALDIGLDNLATCVTNFGTSFIMDGLLSIRNEELGISNDYALLIPNSSLLIPNCIYPEFKRGINLGKKINQQFTQIPFGALRNQLKNLCTRYGMNYMEQEESYTSKASFLDLDEIPIYDAQKPYTGTFSGKRIERGLYRSKSGRLINADVNGAANILRKSKQNLRKCVHSRKVV